MACALGFGGWECAYDHWSRFLDNVSDEPKGYRATCPASGGQRSLSYWAEDRRVAYKCYDRGCDRNQLRMALADRIKTGCVKARKPALDPDYLRALMYSDMPPRSLKLAVLEHLGDRTQDVLEQLGVRPDNRGKVIRERVMPVMPASVLTRNRRSAPPPATSKLTRAQRLRRVLGTSFLTRNRRSQPLERTVSWN